MKDIKDAYKVLGVSEGASKDEIVKRYDVLLKRHRMAQLGQAGNNDQDINLEEVSKAYNLLMGYDTGEPVVYQPGKLNPLYRKFNLDERKVNNFFHYYKFHIIIAIVALIFSITTIRGCITRVPNDFYLTIIGKIYVTDVEPLQQKLSESIPTIKEPGIDVLTMSEEDKGEQAYAMQMKAMAVIAAGDIDVFILDKVNFERYVNQGAFMSLDDLVEKLGIDKDKNKEYIIKSESNPEPHLYGIDITNSSFFKDAKVVGKEKIAAIKFNAKHYDNAVEMLKLLLK